MRGKEKRIPVNDLSELPLKPMAKQMTIPISQFEREYESGIWNGAFKFRNGKPFFIVHLVKEVQREQALQSVRMK